MLEKGQIEELVQLSYQALERNLEERSKQVIKERGLEEEIDAENRRRPRVRSNQPWAAPPFSVPPEGFEPTIRPPFRDVSPTKSTQAQPYFSRPNPPEHIESDRRRKGTVKKAQPEVRFTIPRAQLASDIADNVKKAEGYSILPDDTLNSLDAETPSVRLRLERAKRRKAEAEKVKDTTTVYDLTNFVIPDLEARLEERKQEREIHDLRPQHAKVETEIESSDNERGSEVAH